MKDLLRKSSILSFITARPRGTIEVIGLVLFMIIGLYNRALNNAKSELEMQNATLREGIKSSLSVKGSEVVYKYRDKEGNVKGVKAYLPPEGSVSSITPEEGHKIEKGGFIARAIDKLSTKTVTDPTTGTVIRIKQAGFTFRPALSGIISDHVYLGIQARVLYYNRWGAGIGAALSKANKYAYFFADRRVDDLFPLLQNTSAGAHFGMGKHPDTGATEKKVGVQLSLFF